MIKLKPDTTDSFLEKVNRLEGGNVEHVEFILSGEDNNGEFLQSAEILAYPEGAWITCKIRMINLYAFRFDAKCSSNFFGLSGYPNSLDIIWNKNLDSVIVAFGANVKELTYEGLKESEFWIESKSIEYELYD